MCPTSVAVHFRQVNKSAAKQTNWLVLVQIVPRLSSSSSNLDAIIDTRTPYIMKAFQEACHLQSAKTTRRTPNNSRSRLVIVIVKLNLWSWIQSTLWILYGYMAIANSSHWPCASDSKCWVKLQIRSCMAIQRFKGINCWNCTKYSFIQ